MSTDELIEQFAAFKQAQADAETRAINAGVQAEIVEMRLKLAMAKSAGAGIPDFSELETNRFIEENQADLMSEDVKFLKLIEATPRQVARWWEVSISKVNRTLKRGIFKHGPNSVKGASHLISTVSVVRAVFNGQAKKET